VADRPDVHARSCAFLEPGDGPPRAATGGRRAEVRGPDGAGTAGGRDATLPGTSRVVGGPFQRARGYAAAGLGSAMADSVTGPGYLIRRGRRIS
jgi:hypothetical protein